MRIKNVLLLWPALVLVNTLFAQAPVVSPPPMTEKEVITELKKLGADQMLQDLQRRGVAFETDANTLKKLRKANATDEVIRAIGSAGPMEDAAFNHAKGLERSFAMEQYLKEYPSGRHVREATQLDEDLSYKEASSQNSVTAYQRFLARFPADPRAKEVQETIEESRYNAAVSSDTARAYEAFLADYPQGKLPTLASAHLRQVRLRDARAIATSAAYETFLNQYPNGADSDEIRQSLPVIREFEKSMRLGQVCIELAPKASNMLEVGEVTVGGRSFEVGRLEITKSPTFESNMRELKQLLDAGVAPDAVRISGFQPPSETTPTFDVGVQGLKILSLGNPGAVVPSDRPGMTLLEYCRANRLREACDLLEAHGAK
jgi:hypothetical protein